MKTEYEKLLEQQVAEIEALWAKYSAILSSEEMILSSEEMITLSWATRSRKNRSMASAGVSNVFYDEGRGQAGVVDCPTKRLRCLDDGPQTAAAADWPVLVRTGLARLTGRAEPSPLPRDNGRNGSFRNLP